MAVWENILERKGKDLEIQDGKAASLILTAT